MIRLETERLLIRDHLGEDLAPMHALLSDGRAMRYLEDIRTDSPEGTRSNLAAAMDENERPDRTKYYFAVLDRRFGAYIGEVGYTIRLRTPQGDVAGLGYFILPEWWGRGVTTEAVREVLRYAFEDGVVVKMETGCIRENAASEAVMKKLGMIKEADFALHVWHEGRLKDRVEYGLTKEQWILARRIDA